MILQVFPAPPDLLPFVSGYMYGHTGQKYTQQQPNIPRGMPGLMIVTGENGRGQVEVVWPKGAEPLIFSGFKKVFDHKGKEMPSDTWGGDKFVEKRIRARLEQ